MNNENIDSKLKKLEMNYEALEKVGRNLQEKGATIVEIAVIGKKQAIFFERELPKFFEISMDYPQILNDLPTDDNWITRAIDVTDKALKNSQNAESILSEVTLTVSTSASTISTAGIAAISGEIKLELNYPKVDFRNIYDLQDPQIFLDNIGKKEIADMLASYDPDLEEKRKGAWQTFYSASSDRLSQAANTMRDLIRLFISKYASNDDVKKASWWENDPNTKDGVSLKQRIRFLINEGKSNADFEELKFIEGQVNRFENDFKSLNSIAHGSKRKETAVEASMKSIEQLLLLILQQRTISDRDFKVLKLL